MNKWEIETLCQESMEACRLRIDNLSKPIYSLANLELMAERMAGIFQTKRPNHLKKALVLFAGDHAVNGPQNKTKGQESLEVMKALNSELSATHAVARALAAPVKVVDVALESDTKELENIIQGKINGGTSFFAFGPAMTELAVEKAFTLGAQLAEELHEEGIQAIGLGNVGERAGLTALALTAALYEGELAELLRVDRCSLSVESKLQQLEPLVKEAKSYSPEALLVRFGSADIATMVGFVLRAAALRQAIVFDNAVTGAAVLLAVKINPLVKDYVFASCVYEDPVHEAQLAMVEKKAFLHYRLTVEEGLGSALGLSLLDASLHMLNDMKTFGEAAVTVAEDGPGNGRQNQSVVG